jgi:hypothetical protein
MMMGGGGGGGPMGGSGGGGGPMGGMGFGGRVKRFFFIINTFSGRCPFKKGLGHQIEFKYFWKQFL